MAVTGHDCSEQCGDTNFVEGGISYGGFRFIVDRTDGAQPGDGSEWLFFTVPEPSVPRSVS